MTLTVDSNVIPTVISNSDLAIQNSYVIRERNLKGELITQKVSIVDKKTEILELQAVPVSVLNALRNLEGEDVACSLTGVGGHNFSGTYNVEVNEETLKSYNETQNFTITLHKT